MVYRSDGWRVEVAEDGWADIIKEGQFADLADRHHRVWPWTYGYVLPQFVAGVDCYSPSGGQGHDYLGQDGERYRFTSEAVVRVPGDWGADLPLLKLCRDAGLKFPRLEQE